MTAFRADFMQGSLDFYAIFQIAMSNRGAEPQGLDKKGLRWVLIPHLWERARYEISKALLHDHGSIANAVKVAMIDNTLK